MRDLPPYITNGNLYDALDSVELSGVVMHAFCVKADRSKIQAWLDKTFSGPSAGAVRYEAVGDKVFLGFAEIERATLVGPLQGAKGYSSEIDVTVWLLARRLDDGLLAMRWIPAYLFVDSGPALVTGREVWGFPKQLGRFDFSPQQPDRAAARTFTAQGWVVSPYAPDAHPRWATMFEVRPREPAKKSGVLATLEALAEKAVTRLTDEMISFADSVNAAIAGGSIIMAFLKQFPDAARPTRACYQAVVEAEARVTKMRGSGLTDDHYDLRITSYDSHPYLDELGILPDWQDVGQGVWVDFDFRQQLGSELWRAGG